MTDRQMLLYKQTRMRDQRGGNWSWSLGQTFVGKVIPVDNSGENLSGCQSYYILKALSKYYYSS